MKLEKMFLVAALLGLILSMGLVGPSMAADSVYDWGPWEKMITPAAGPSVATLAVTGPGGFEYAPPRPSPAPPIPVNVRPLQQNFSYRPLVDTGRPSLIETSRPPMRESSGKPPLGGGA
jgi:hypothetical protein